MNDFLKAPKTKMLLWILCGVLVVLITFGLGVAIGYRRAIFASDFGENYYHNLYGDPFGNPMVGVMNNGPLTIHGVVGQVIDVGSTTMSVENLNGNEESVFVASNTPIREMNNMIPLVEIDVGDHVTVIGEPNQNGQVEARFIRVFTAPMPPMQ
jgi:hypothetical protein